MLDATGYLHESGRVSMDEAEGGDRCTNLPTHRSVSIPVCVSLSYCMASGRQIKLAYRGCFTEWRSIEKGGAAVAPRN